MPSSTSSFERSVPRGSWPLSGLIALLIFLVTMTAWEFKVRADGYQPSINESSDLWASTRSKVSGDPGQTVIVGSSRIQFDFDQDTWMAHSGGTRPIQLAMPGTNPVALLEDVADSDFRGNLILGVTPGLWFVPEGSPVTQAETAVGRYRNWSPSQKAGLQLGMALQKRLAFINGEELTLPHLLHRIKVDDRPGALANLGPVEPPYFAGADRYRQARMWYQCDFGSPLALRIQKIWLGLFTPPPPPPHLSPEEFQEMLAGNMEAHLGRIQTAVETIRARGGRIVFVRPPSAGELRELEKKFSPREGFWDRMLAVTGAPGIHFEDHPEFADFDCPEWSHLTAEDAVKFTRILAPMVTEALETQGS